MFNIYPTVQKFEAGNKYKISFERRLFSHYENRNIG